MYYIYNKSDRQMVLIDASMFLYSKFQIVMNNKIRNNTFSRQISTLQYCIICEKLVFIME